MYRRLLGNTLLAHPRPRVQKSERFVSRDEGGYATQMFENYWVRQHQKKRDNVSPDFHKKTTGMCGLYVNEHPHHDLKALYKRLLRVLAMIPEQSLYRQSTEEIVKQRLAHVEQEPDIQKLEERIGMGQIEEVIEQAENELQTARIFVQHQAWEPLVEAPLEEQWRWPV